MKKTIRLLLGTLGIATVALMGAGCSSNSFKQMFCKHDYGVTETSILEDATCYKKGKALWTCNICGKEKKADIEKTEHTYDEGTVIEEATCTEEGSIKYVCQNQDCGEEKIDVIEILAHKPVNVPALVPTCTEEGHTAYTYCSDCNEYLLEKQVIPALGHSTVLVRGYEETCTQNGLTDGLGCVMCGETLEKREVIPAHGHTVKNIPAIQATCTEDGATAGSACATCDTVFVKPEVVPSLGGHVMDEKTGTCKWCDFEFKHTLENGYVLEYVEEYSGTIGYERVGNSEEPIKTTVKDCYILTNPNGVAVENLEVPAFYKNKKIHVAKDLFDGVSDNLKGSLKKVTFENSCVIFDYAFSGCYRLETVSFPEDADITFCRASFANCGKLKSVNVRTSIIGSSAFANCYNLETFTVIGSQTVRIGGRGIDTQGDKLTSFQAKNVRFMEGSPFGNQNNLKTLSFEEAYLDNSTFAGLTANTIKIEECSYIGIGVFDDCTANIYIADITDDFSAYSSPEIVFGNFAGKIYVGSGVMAKIQAKTGWDSGTMEKYFAEK